MIASASKDGNATEVPVYVYTQRSRSWLRALLKAFIAVFAVFVLYLAVIGLWPALAFGVGVCGGLGLAVYVESRLALTVRVEASRLHWTLVPFAQSHSVAISDIVRVEPVRMSPLRPGFGVTGSRWVPGLGTVYGVPGREAVRITTSGRPPFCLTTDEPERLVHAIETARLRESTKSPQTPP